MSSPSDRFKVVETALMPPGVCRVCGGASKDWYIDFGYNEDTYGAVYYCNECIGAMADACGFLTPAALQALNEEVEALRAKNFELQVRTDGLEKALDGLCSAGFTVSRDPAWVDGGSPEPAFTGAATGDTAPTGGANPESQPGDQGGTRAGTSPEPSSESGMDDVHPTRGVEESGAGGFRFTV